ncbi:MAG: hypothetical protein ABFD17_01990 [Anaerolineaceae bacterium]
MKKIFAYRWFLFSAFFLILLLSACAPASGPLRSETELVTETNTVQNQLKTEPPELDATPTIAADQNANIATGLTTKKVIEQLQSLLALRTQILSEKGWAHSLQKVENYWDVFCLNNPDKCAIMPEDWYRGRPPKHSLEQWVELDESGHQAGNSIALWYQEDGTPLRAMVETSDFRIAQFYLDADCQPQELIQKDNKMTATTEGQSVDQLFPDYVNKVEEQIESQPEGKTEVEMRQVVYEGHQAIEVKTTRPWASNCQQRDPFPEPTCAVVTIQVIDQESGMLWLDWQGALGASGELHPERIETLISFEILTKLSDEVLELRDTLLDAH